MFKGLVLVLAGALTLSLTGCGATKDWVIDYAKRTAVDVVDSRIDKFNENTLGPRLELIEKQVGKIDADNDGEFSDEELLAKMKEQVVVAVEGLKGAVYAESDASLTERLKDYATTDDSFMNMVYLAIIYILGKFGIKTGPAGLKGLRNFLERRKTKVATEEHVDLS